MPRIPRGQLIGHAFHLLNRGNGRATIFHNGDVDEVGEIARKVTEVAIQEIDGAGLDAQRLHLVALIGIAEAGDAPHLVIPRQRPGDAERDAAGRPGDQNLFS